MQNVGQSENRNIDKVNVQLDVVKSSTPQSSASSPAKSETETYSGAPAKYMTDSSESEDDSVSEVKRVLFSVEAVAVGNVTICTALKKQGTSCTCLTIQFLFSPNLLISQ